MGLWKQKMALIFLLKNIIRIRDWVWNVLNCIAFDRFKKLIENALKEREEYCHVNNVNVGAVPEITNIFENSQNVSISKENTISNKRH